VPQPNKVSQTSSKFSGLFEDARSASPATAEGRAEVRTEKRQPGRPAGKRSNPDFKPRTLLIRESLHLEATDILHARRTQEGKQDLSDIVNDLLEKWIKAQRVPA